MVARSKDSTCLVQAEEWFDHFKRKTDGDVSAAAMLALTAATLGARGGMAAPPKAESTVGGMKVAEVAHALQCSTETVYDMIRQGKIIAHRVGTGKGSWRVRPLDLEAYCNGAAASKPLRHLRV